jgi:heptosyltransferase-3
MTADLPDTGRVLVIAIARIGDTLLATPLLRALRAWVPDAALTCIAHPKRCAVLAGLPCIDHLLPMTKRSAIWRARLPGNPYDLAVVLGRDPVILRYARRSARQLVAFRQPDPALGRLIDLPVATPSQPMHAVDERLLLAEALGAPAAGKRLAYVVGAGESAWAEGWLASHGLRGKRLIGLQVASFPTKAYRDWPEAHFREIARCLIAAYPDIAVLLLGDRPDRPRADRIAAGLDRAHAVAGGFDLRQAAALMARLSLYVGVDTGPTHLAGALGIPMVALYHCKHRGRHLAPLDHPAYLAVVEHPAGDGDCTEASVMAAIGVDDVWPRIVEALA